MSERTKRHIWPVSLATALAVVGVMAAFIVLTSTPGTAQAQGLCDTATGATLQALIDAGVCQADPGNGTDPGDGDGNGDGNGNGNGDGNGDGAVAVSTITSDSTSGSGAPEFKVVIGSLPGNLAVGSSIVLYLEDDYQEPEAIPASSVYFVADKETSPQTGNGARVYTTIAPKIDTGAYFDEDKKDISIRVFIPDMCTNATDACEGPNAPIQGQRLTMVVEDNSGIKNPTEAGTHSILTDILGPADSVPLAATTLARNNALRAADKLCAKEPTCTDDNQEQTLRTVAKISLSDVDNVRGYELTITGSGFNDGTTASVWVLGRKPTTAEWWNTLNCDERNALVDPVKEVTDAAMGTSPCTPYAGLTDADKAIVDDADTTKGNAEIGVCRVVIDKGTDAGSGLVGSDDTVAVSFEVTVPTFGAGNNNFICMNDGENRQSSTDVEDFHLEPSIRVVPSSVKAGDTVNVFAQDYPFSSESLTVLKLAGTNVTNAVANLRNQSLVNGSAAISFEVPGSVGGAPLQGTVRVDAQWGSPITVGGLCNAAVNCTSEDSKITVTGSELAASVTNVLPNESITITGNGFGSQTCIDIANIQLDGVALQVEEESTSSCDADSDGVNDDIGVEVSNSGQFVATITLWPAGFTADNPTLIDGTHTLDVVDGDGFAGSTTLTIAEPTISVLPNVVGPRDYVVITGTNWPIDNVDNSNAGLVSVKISDDRNERMYSVYTDNTGRFTIEHRVSKDVAIPSTNQVTGTYSDVVKVGSFAVPAASITVTPSQAQPGDMVSVSATDMKPYAEADYVKVGGTAFNDPGANTDIDGNITIDDVLIPGLDPGTYSVVIEVDGTVAIGEVEVLAEDSARGAGAELPDAVSELGDSLVRVFHFNGVDKSWDFYDPRADFADLNTLTTMVNGEPYWILVSEGQEDVVLNNKPRTLTCVGGDCWNQLVW